MKKFIFTVAILGGLMCSSCATIFTSSRQTVTFTGKPGTTIYDKSNKIASINEEGVGTAKIKKQLTEKTLMAKLNGYKTLPIVLSTTLNPVAILNLADIFGWAIDVATGKVCKYSEDVVEIGEMEPTSPSK